MISITNLQSEIVCPTEVELMYPRSTSTVCFSILTLVVLQILILLYKCPEVSTVSLILEIDFAVVAWDVHQVIANSITIDITIVHVAITTRSAT